MIFSTQRSPRRRPAGILLSLSTHASLFLIAFLLTLHWGKVRPVYRDSRCCTAQLYWNSNTGVSDSSPATPMPNFEKSTIPVPESTQIENPVHLRRPRMPQHEAARNHLARSGAISQLSQQTTGTGSGADDAEPAFPTYFPRPAVTDRSLLPAVEQKIIVEVTINADGDVTDEKLVQGFGNSLDDLVMSTVKGWRFHPATLNGNNIASIERLVFPFNRDYPSGDGSNS
jgi:TonB family protein